MKREFYIESFIPFLYLITVCLNINSQSNIIRAKCFIDHPKYWERFLNLKPLFTKHGLHLVDHNPDVILCNRINSTITNYRLPIIILERKASAYLWTETRLALKHPQVKAVFKNRIFRNKHLYNGPHCDESFHFKIINDHAKLFNPSFLFSLTTDDVLYLQNQNRHLMPKNLYPPYLNYRDLDKIKCVIWSLDYSPFSARSEQLKNMIIDFKKQRPIDVFFSGRVIMKGDVQSKRLYTWHRQQAINKLKKINGLKLIIGLDRTYFSFEKYVRYLKKTKIGVAPWGTGEWTHRDYEIIHCGAVLIKPDTGFVQAIPDIYQNNLTYVPCKSDFSDLEEKIRTVLKNYDKYWAMRKYAKNILVSGWNLDKIAMDFVNAIKEALGR